MRTTFLLALCLLATWLCIALAPQDMAPPDQRELMPRDGMVVVHPISPPTLPNEQPLISAAY
ncbi:MAG: hypothetical protein AAGI71_07605 [Bacteroidota bacterium]